jgi:hypothetical protein
MWFQFSNPSLIRSSPKLNQSETRIGHERHACWLICTKITPFGYRYDITSQKITTKFQAKIYCARRAFRLIKTHQRRSGRKVRNIVTVYIIVYMFWSVIKRITGSVYERLIKTQLKSIDFALFLAHLTQRIRIRMALRDP